MEKIVVITGACGGLGSQLTKKYLAKGYHLILNDLNEQQFQEYQGNDNVEIIVGDLTHQETIDKIVAASYNFGHVDILINNAGITYIQPFEKNTPEQLDKILAIDLKAPMLLTQKLYPLMIAKGSGTIVNINSTAGKEAKINHTMYNAAKFGLSGFTQSLRLEAKQHGIRVLSIHPGGINTHFYDLLETPVDVSDYMDPTKVAELIVTLSETENLSPDEIVISRLSK